MGFKIALRHKSAGIVHDLFHSFSLILLFRKNFRLIFQSNKFAQYANEIGNKEKWLKLAKNYIMSDSDLNFTIMVKIFRALIAHNRDYVGKNPQIFTSKKLY